MKKMIECPVCDGKAALSLERKKRIFRKEEYDVYEYFYKCEKCGESFTDEETGNYNVNQVYNLYRERFGIPFPEQLRLLRQKYGFSASQMSQVLGFGPNQYRLYENGEIPSESNGTLLSVIINPEEFKIILFSKKHLFKGKKYENTIEYIDELIAKSNPSMLNKFFPNDIIPNSYTGFTLPNFDKFANMVLYFIEAAEFKVKLNKLMFYADFAHFKFLGKSISGCTYAAIPMGPVINDYSFILGLLEEQCILGTELVEINSNLTDKYVPLKKFSNKLFSESELETLEYILDTFGGMNTKKIVEISHKEEGWKANEKARRVISYPEYAPVLVGV